MSNDGDAGFDLNGLDSETLQEGLLQYNYFPRQHDHKEELPPIFNTELFTADVAKKVLACPRRKKGGYDILPYRRTRHPNIPRMMGIPHPRAYVELVDAITSNWTEHIGPKCQSPNSQLEFGSHDDKRIIVLTYNYIAANGEIEGQDPLADFGQKYIIKTDITNFFHSIYSHSLPWALVGHSEAKREQSSKDKWFNQLDFCTRLCQRNETKGIPIGPATSSILSEIILTKVDAALTEGGSYQFTRYIDDYTAYVKSDSDADAFLLDLTAELEKYTLTLNPKKTSVERLPVPDKADWIADINLFFGFESVAKQEGDEAVPRKKISFRQLKHIINKAISLSKKFPDGSVLKYAFSAIIESGIENDRKEAMQYFQDSCLRYSFYFPTIIPIIQRWLPSTDPEPHREHRVHQKIKALLNRSFEQRQSDNIVWCIYYLLQMRDETDNGLLQKCCNTDDPLVILTGYVYAKIKGTSIAPVTKWANGKIEQLKNGDLHNYDIDRFWLVMYQLYFEDNITTPYDDSDENKVFETLKSENVSFVNWKHDDFDRLSRWATKLFGGVRLP